jgi:putative Ca2+/H+ antiporter (TMEM165/GDT1 family)
MQTFLISTATVALAEIGDKTQLLSLILAAKYRKPWPICLGILVATLANHAIAAEAGALVAAYLTPEVLKWIVALSFFSVALWTLKPDQADDAGRDEESFQRDSGPERRRMTTPLLRLAKAA